MSDRGYRLTVEQGGVVQRFQVGDERSLLESMHELGLPVRKACRNGACGVCRCQLVSGQIDYGSRYPHALWQVDIDAGVILPCIARPASDLQLADLPLVQPKC